MFMGEYSHSIDAKGRLIVPARFRDELGDNFVITKGLDGCLYIYPASEWMLFQEKLSKLPLNDKNARKMVRFFVSGAADCELDKQGRFLIPATQREFAGITKEVVLAGSITRIEVWSKERWSEDSNYDDVDAIAEEMQGLGLSL